MNRMINIEWTGDSQDNTHILEILESVILFQRIELLPQSD